MFSQPVQILLVILAGLMTRQERAVIDYLMEENACSGSCSARSNSD